TGGALVVSADGNLGAVPASEAKNVTLTNGSLQLGASFNLNGNRDIFIGAPQGTINTNGFNTTLSSKVIGTGTLIKAGVGTLLVDVSANDITVVAGTLGGKGSVGNVKVNTGATLNPGDSPGFMTVASAFFDPGSTLTVEINGTAGGTLYDQLEV